MLVYRLSRLNLTLYHLHMDTVISRPSWQELINLSKINFDGVNIIFDLKTVKVECKHFTPEAIPTSAKTKMWLYSTASFRNRPITGNKKALRIKMQVRFPKPKLFHNIDLTGLYKHTLNNWGSKMIEGSSTIRHLKSTVAWPLTQIG